MLRAMVRSSCVGPLAALVFLTPLAARAEEPLPTPSRSVTLEQARGEALAHQPVLRAARARALASRAGAAVPSAQWLPTIGGTAQVFLATSNQWSGSTLGVPGVDLLRVGGTSAKVPGTFEPHGSTLLA